MFGKFDEEMRRRQLDTVYYTSHDVVQAIKIYVFDLSPRISLPGLLKSFGPPDEIWVGTDPEPEMDGEWHFGLAIYYASVGALAEYFVLTQPQGDTLVACPGGASSPFLAFWNPDLAFTIEQARALFGTSFENSWFLPLEEATAMTISSFTAAYRDQHAITCLRTPRDLWWPD